MRIAFATFGCKINQYETDLLRQDFASQGNTIVPFEGEADVYIINTCSVTAKSDTECRRTIRAAVRRGCGARVVVTGCYAETRADEVKNIPGVDLVIGNDDKSAIPRRFLSSLVEPPPAGAGGSPQQRDLPELLTRDASFFTVARKRFLPPAGAGGCQGAGSPPLERDRTSLTGVAVKAVQGRTRGILKIQTGCDNHCSYCIVPLARGRSRSASPSDVVKEFEQLVQAGCPEIVLTGIHIGAYGNDLPDRMSLTDMLAMLLAKRGGARLRLSSIEPREITTAMIRLLGNGLCRHLHIPLQSGDDGILSSMKRNYTSRFYRELLDHIEKEVPGVAIGADVMVGYPGEGDAEFQNTMRLVESAPLTHLHVFSYSPRPDTRAATMKDQVSDSTKKERNETLRRLGKEKNIAFRKKNLGSTLNVVVEDKMDAETGLLSGLTDNYIRVRITGAKKELVGKEIQVRVTRVEKDDNFAVVI
jgi:threonylcarbamoyladenosine tRNA methylthiotransferase MtaB